MPKIVEYTQTKAYQSAKARRDARDQYVKDRKRAVATSKGRVGSRPVSETEVDKVFCNMCKRENAYIVKLHPVTDAGIPDRLVIRYGQTLYVEIKRPDAKCRPVQISMHKKMRAHGADVYVLDRLVTTWEDFVRYRYTTYPGPEYYLEHDKLDPEYGRQTFADMDAEEEYETFETLHKYDESQSI